MVTKQEIENECQKKIEQLQKELIILEEQHKGFTFEDEEDEKRIIVERKLSLQLNEMEYQQYEGNFGTKIDWYHGRIPNRFVFNEEDREEIKKALNEIRKENLEEMENTNLYKKISKDREKVLWSNFSSQHTALHLRIEDLKYKIQWNENRIKMVQDKGEMIKIGRDETENKKRQISIKEERDKINKYKDMIRKQEEVKVE